MATATIHGGLSERSREAETCARRPTGLGPVGKDVTTVARSYATPGQAGLPAEFKHINKRRKRN